MADRTPDTNASAREPDGSRADLLSQAETLFNSGKIAEADTLYARILADHPDAVRALVGKAITGTRLRGDSQTALSLLDRAAALAPGRSHIPQTRAAILNERGDFDGAVAAARAALAIDPRCALAFVNLTDSTRVAPDDPVFAMGEAALATPDLPEQDRSLINFALGKAYQDCGEYDRAFAHFDAGNLLKPALAPFSRIRDVADRHRALFSPAYCRGLTGAVKTTPRPIFIIGMPRSGTTLLERMLVAHPEVTTAGERQEMNSLIADFFSKAQAAQPDRPPEEAIRRAMTPANLANVARAYMTPVARAADHRRPNVIDKMPVNFWNLGLIAATFADAPILHLRRNPLDTCLSNYLANFRTGMTFSNRLDTLGRYFRLYVDLMQHWEEVFPGRITTIDYETLVTDPEPEARRILSACNLGWHDACLHPEESDGMIATASRWQARQKINTASVEKWRRYEAHLDPLIDALGGMAWIDDFEARRRSRG